MHFGTEKNAISAFFQIKELWLRMIISTVCNLLVVFNSDLPFLIIIA